MKNATVYAAYKTAKGIATKKAKADGKEYVVKPLDEGFVVVEKAVKAPKAPKAPAVPVEAKLALVKETPNFLYVNGANGEETFLIKKALLGFEVNKNLVKVNVTAAYAKKRAGVFAAA